MKSRPLSLAHALGFILTAALEFYGLSQLWQARASSTLEPTPTNTWKITGKNGPDRYVDRALYRSGNSLVIGGIVCAMVLGASLIPRRPSSKS